MTSKSDGVRRFGPMQTLRYRSVRRALDRPKRGKITVRRDIAVTMDDGTRLLTDHWAPHPSRTAQPVMVLIRTPYGRDGFGPDARALAEAGHHVVIQSCRGHWGSGGKFDPLRDERADGFACVRWLETQPWFPGKVVTYGSSYVGFTQWAIAEGAPESVAGMVIAISARSFRDSVLRFNGGFGMELCTTWTLALSFMEKPLGARLRAQLGAARAIKRGSNVAHPRDAARRTTGSEVAFYQDWLSHDIDDPWWDPVQYARDLSSVPPISLIAGWYDLFLPGQIDDYHALSAADRDVRLVVGEWSHMSSGIGVEAIRELWFRLGRVGEGARVRLQPVGGKQWLDQAAWPPPSSTEILSCSSDGLLAAPPQSEGEVLNSPSGGEVLNSPSRGVDAAPPPSGDLLSDVIDPAASVVVLRYDPSEPTPSRGGKSLNPLNAGPKNQARREKRSDVLTWTGKPSGADRVIAGEVVASVVSSSDGPSDLFVRLCVVDAKGKSINIADGYQRHNASPDAEMQRISLGPLVAKIPARSRLRLQISGGAHPLHLRHPGNADALHDWSNLQTTERQIRCGPGQTHLEIPYLTG